MNSAKITVEVDVAFDKKLPDQLLAIANTLTQLAGQIAAINAAPSVDVSTQAEDD